MYAFELVANMIFLLHKIDAYIPESAYIKIFKFIILPYLDYGDNFCMNSNIDQHKLPTNYQISNRNIDKILNNRNICTQLHDTPAFVTIKPNCAKLKQNII